MNYGHRVFVGRLLAFSTVFLIITSMFSIGIAAQTPMPESAAFRLVAKVRAGEWISPLPAPEPGIDIGEGSLLDALREGGFVIYFRHASTDFSQSDDDIVDLANCATQRNLSETGRHESRLIGESIDDLDIPIGDVFSSEMCRTRDTAELAFGEVKTLPDLLPSPAGSEEEDERTEGLRSLFATPPMPGTNTVLVGHLHNLTLAANVILDEAEAAILLPSESRSGNDCSPVTGADGSQDRAAEPYRGYSHAVAPRSFFQNLLLSMSR